jgi:hypothetical protein
MENQPIKPFLKSAYMNSDSPATICTTGMIQDYYFNHFLIVDQLPFDFEYEHTELFGFID